MSSSFDDLETRPPTWSDGLEQKIQRPAQSPQQGFEVLGELGKGAMGQVFLAFDNALNRQVAVKRVDPEIAGPLMLARFRAEVQITAQLEHPGVVPVHTLRHTDQGLPEYVMKVVRGDTLHEWLKPVHEAHRAGEVVPRGRDLRSRLEVFLDVCDTLEYAHSRKVIHRDIKPDNVMIGPYRQVYLMDWGLAKVLGMPDAGSTWTFGVESAAPQPSSSNEAGAVSTSPGSAAKTRIGATLGTPAYMAPEQAKDAATVGPAADQFSLGVLLFELVTLRHARPHDSAGEALGLAHLGTLADWSPAYPSVELPESLRAVVEKATAKTPGNRYVGVAELSADIRRFLRNEPVSVFPDTPLRSVARRVQRRPQSVVIGGLVFAVLMVAAVGATLVRSAQVQVQQREASAQREHELTQLLVDAAEQGHRIDTALRKYESVLNGLVYAAEHALANPVEPRQVFLPDAWLFEQTRPATAQSSDHYQTIASIRDVDYGFAPTADPDRLTQQIQQLASLQPMFRDALLDSHSPEARALDSARRDVLALEEGTPIVWSYVATEDGVIAGLPGTPDTYEPGYDPRTRPWYQLASGSAGPQWSALDGDESGMGLLLTCSQAVRDGGKILGVAGVDLTFGHVIDDLMGAEETAEIEAFLVDAEGRVIVRASQAAAARTVREYKPEAFPWPGVVSDVIATDRPTGHVENEDKLFVWAGLEAVPWRYVLVGPAL